MSEVKPIIKITAAQIEDFLGCGHKYFLKQCNIPYKINDKILLGRIMHSIIHNDAVSFIEEGKFLTAEQLVKIADNICYNEIKIANDQIDEKIPPSVLYIKLKEGYSELLQGYMALREREDYKPVYSEDVGAAFEYEINYDDYAIILPCRMDLITENNTVWEFKFKGNAGRIPARYNVSTHLQSNIYLIALEEVFGGEWEMKYCIMRKNEYSVFTGKLNESVKEKTLSIIEQIAKAIFNNIYLPASQDENRSWLCNYCGVSYACKYTLKNKEEL